MKIVAFSDIHGQQDKLTQWCSVNPADLLIFAGDLQGNQTTDDGTNFMEWLHRLPYPFKIIVFGNHDGHYDIASNYVLNNQYHDIVILNNNSLIYQGIKFFGSPHSVEFGSWWFMMKDEELANLWKKIPDDTDILITHGPPYSILDNTVYGVYAGSKSLWSRVTQSLPNLKYHIFGHIHEAAGTETLNGITYMNVSALNERYQFTRNPITFYYGEGGNKVNYNVGE